MFQTQWTLVLAIMLAPLLGTTTSNAMFYPCDDETEYTKDLDTENSNVTAKMRTLSLNQLPDDMLILVASIIIDPKTFNDQSFFDQKARLENIFNLMRTNKSLHKKIIKNILPKLIDEYNQAHDQKISSRQSTAMLPKNLSKIFKKTFYHQTFKQGGGSIIGIEIDPELYGALLVLCPAGFLTQQIICSGILFCGIRPILAFLASKDTMHVNTDEVLILSIFLCINFTMVTTTLIIYKLKTFLNPIHGKQ